MSHKIPKLNSHVHSTGVPNYNLSHSSLSSCTKIPSHALLNFQLLSFCPCFPFSPFIFHTTGPISQIVNASKTGTIDYTLDTNVTPDDETRQAFCQMICFSTQFCCFWEHFEHDVPPKKCRWNFMFSQEIDNLLRKYCKWWTPPPLLMGTFLGYLGQLDCHEMTAIYSLFLFLPLLYNCHSLCGFGAPPWEFPERKNR